MTTVDEARAVLLRYELTPLGDIKADLDAFEAAIRAERLDVEVLARAIWHHYHEAEEGLYEDASQAHRLSVRDFAESVAAEYARLESDR